jgi:nucleoside-diphosphate-sugar epimerase
MALKFIYCLTHYLFTLQPQDAYGLEKLATEELCKHYTKDFGIECRIGRFHSTYGPFRTWKGKFTS